MRPKLVFLDLFHLGSLVCGELQAIQHLLKAFTTGLTRKS